MDLKSTYSVFKFCLKWKEMFISLKFNNIRNENFPQNSFMCFFRRFMHIFIHIIIIAIKIALNDANNFRDTCTNTAIDTFSATILLLNLKMIILMV